MSQADKASKPAVPGKLSRSFKRVAHRLGPGGDGLTLLLSAVVLLSATWVLDRAWAEELPSLSAIAIIALGLGFLLARSPVPRVASHLTAIFSGAGVSLWLGALSIPDANWKQRLVGLETELVSWGQAAVTDAMRDGNIEFIVLMVGLFWALGYLAAWHSLRYQRAWGVVLPCGLVLLITLSNLPEVFYSHILLYLASSVLLVVHTNLLRRQREWGLGRVGYSPLLGVAHVSFVVAFGLVAVLVAWKAPPVKAAPLSAALDRATAPWVFIQDQFSRLFSALPAKKPFLTLRWGSTLAFGGPPQLSNQILFTVESKVPRYWRARVYDIYTSLGWRSSLSTGRLLAEGPVEEKGDALALRSRITHWVRLNAATDTLFMAGEPVSASIPAVVVARSDQPQDIFSVRSDIQLRLFQRYKVVSDVSAAKPEHLRQAGVDYPRWISEPYLQLPSTIPRQVRRLSREVTASTFTPYDKTIAIRDYLLTFPYNLNIKGPSLGRDGVDYFLFSQKAGYCDYYASAMVVMLRSVGVPARFVVGYATGEWDGGKKVYMVRELQYHSWPEVYFPGYGWVEFEPTPPQAIEFTNQPALIPPQTVSDEDEGGGGAVAEEEDIGEAAGIAPHVVRRLVIGTILAVVTLLAVAWYRWWGRLVKLGYPAEIYAKMGRLGSLLGMAPQPQLTPLEYAQRISAHFPAQAPAINYITQAYVKARYGPKKFLLMEERETVAQAWRTVRRALLVRRLRSQHL